MFAGAGTFGTVRAGIYRPKNGGPEVECAIKVLKPADECPNQKVNGKCSHPFNMSMYTYMYTVFTLCIYTVFILSLCVHCHCMYLHGVYIVIVYIYMVCTLSLYVHCIYMVCTLSLYIFTWYVHCHCMYTVFTWCVHCHCVYTVCTLYVHCMNTMNINFYDHVHVGGDSPRSRCHGRSEPSIHCQTLW